MLQLPTDVILDKMLSVEIESEMVPENKRSSSDWLNENTEMNELFAKVLGSATRVEGLSAIKNDDEPSMAHFSFLVPNSETA